MVFISINTFFFVIIFFIAKDKLQLKSVVIGQPVLLALEEIDGTPTFLEKALRFIEEHGENLLQLILKELKIQCPRDLSVFFCQF